jgi:hypothetical protein
VPAEATAAAINLTVVNGTVGSFLTLYPTGMDRPLASAINWADNVAHANSTVIKLGTDKSFDIYNNSGRVDVVVDLVGYYIPSTGGGGGGHRCAGPAGAPEPRATRATPVRPVPMARTASTDERDRWHRRHERNRRHDGTNGIDGIDGTNGIDGINGITASTA